MDKYLPKSLNKLIYQLSKLPGVGAKSAQRLAFHIIAEDREDVIELAKSMVYAKDNIKTCMQCFNISEDTICDICKDDTRDKSIICVVENPKDLIAMERSGSYRGQYHVLGGVISPMENKNPEDINIKELLVRIKDETIKEVILATGSSIEGETTAMYLARLLKDIVKITRLAAGIPVGGDLEYADEITLARALEGRREM